MKVNIVQTVLFLLGWIFEVYVLKLGMYVVPIILANLFLLLVVTFISDPKSKEQRIVVLEGVVYLLLLLVHWDRIEGMKFISGSWFQWGLLLVVVVINLGQWIGTMIQVAIKKLPQKVTIRRGG